MSEGGIRITKGYFQLATLAREGIKENQNRHVAQGFWRKKALTTKVTTRHFGLVSDPISGNSGWGRWMKRNPVPRRSHVERETKNLWRPKLLTRIDAAGRCHYRTIRVPGSRTAVLSVLLCYASSARCAAEDACYKHTSALPDTKHWWNGLFVSN